MALFLKSMELGAGIQRLEFGVSGVRVRGIKVKRFGSDQLLLPLELFLLLDFGAGVLGFRN